MDCQTLETLIGWIPDHGMSRRQKLRHVSRALQLKDTAMERCLNASGNDTLPFDRMPDLLKLAHPRHAAQVRAFVDAFHHRVLDAMEDRARKALAEADTALQVVHKARKASPRLRPGQPAVSVSR